MEIPQKYSVDPAIASKASSRLAKRRYNLGSNNLSDEEKSILTSTLKHMNHIRPGDQPAFTAAFIQAIAAMFQYARLAYDNLTIGSWSFAGFWVLRDLGTSISEMGPKSFFEQIHYKSQITTALMLPSGITLDSLVALNLKHLIKQGLGTAVVHSLASEREQHDKQIEIARQSKSINEWLKQLTEVSPLTDAQYLIYRCIVQLANQGHLSAEELSKQDLDLKKCQEEENKLEEIAAYTYSPGISLYKDNPEKACMWYLSTIIEKAQKEGTRVAKRQARYDFTRLMIPRFLMEDAFAALGEKAYRDRNAHH